MIYLFCMLETQSILLSGQAYLFLIANLRLTWHISWQSRTIYPTILRLSSTKKIESKKQFFKDFYCDKNRLLVKTYLKSSISLYWWFEWVKEQTYYNKNIWFAFILFRIQVCDISSSDTSYKCKLNWSLRCTGS